MGIRGGAFESGLGDLRKRGLRGIKLIPIGIEEYFAATPRRFDIIYIDACGPLPSHDKKTTRLLTNLFRYSALAPLGVLITNFARPDIEDADQLQRHAFLIASYLYPKSSLDSKRGGLKGSASEKGWELKDDENPRESLFHKVTKNFDHYYGSFITRHIMDIAALIAPIARFSYSNLRQVLFDKPFEEAVKRGSRFVRFNPDAFDFDEHPQSGAEPIDLIEGAGSPAAKEDTTSIDDIISGTARTYTAEELGLDADAPDIDGDAITEPSHYSLLWTLAACGCYTIDINFEPPPADVATFLTRWINQLSGTPVDAKKPADVVAAYYAWRQDPGLWSEAMQKIADYPYWGDMPFLCDVPTKEIGFYPTLAQLAYPAQCNIREAKRFSYVAEGKSTAMFLDVLAFDECRYVYDWLSGVHLVPDDWSDRSAQLTFRFALDAIAKEQRWYADDFLFGCHVVGIDRKFLASELAPRRKIRAKKSEPI